VKTHIIWTLVAISALLVGTQFAKKEIRVVERPVEVVKTNIVVVEKPVEVIKEVPKEVERIVERKVEVPAKISEEYEDAMAFMKQFRAREEVSKADALAGVKSVGVEVTLDDDVKKIISEEEIRTKFEITLRRSGVPINEESRFRLFVSQTARLRETGLLIFSSQTEFAEAVILFRGESRMAEVITATWEKGAHGVVGKDHARDTFIQAAEEGAEAFANTWLAKNPAKK
jgi:hypothetical protein